MNTNTLKLFALLLLALPMALISCVKELDPSDNPPRDFFETGPIGTAQITVLNSKGEGLLDVPVSLALSQDSLANKEFLKTQYTNSSGVVTFEKVPVGKYYFFAMKDKQEGIAVATVQEDQTATAEIMLKGTGTLRVMARTGGLAGPPVPEAFIGLAYSMKDVNNGNFFMQGLTDAVTNLATFEKVPADSIYVFAAGSADPTTADKKGTVGILLKEDQSLDVSVPIQ